MLRNSNLAFAKSPVLAGKTCRFKVQNGTFYNAKRHVLTSIKQWADNLTRLVQSTTSLLRTFDCPACARLKAWLPHMAKSLRTWQQTICTTILCKHCGWNCRFLEKETAQHGRHHTQCRFRRRQCAHRKNSHGAPRRAIRATVNKQWPNANHNAPAIRHIY